MEKKNLKKFPYIIDKRRKRLIVFNLKDFFIFRKKFFGSLINKGKKSYSMKIYNYILYNLKNYKKINPFLIFFILVENIVPTVNLMQKKQKRKIISMPSFLYGNQKNVILIKWLVKQLKNKSNIYGIKKEDLLNNLIETYNLKGIAIKAKRDHYEKIRSTKINLKKLAGTKETRRLKKSAILEWKDSIYFKKQEVNEMKQVKKFNKGDNFFDEEDLIEEYELFKKAKIKFFIKRLIKNFINKKKKSKAFLKWKRKLKRKYKFFKKNLLKKKFVK